MYTNIAKHYEDCLKAHGPTPKGVDWPNQADLNKRHNVMLDLFLGNEADAIKLIDLGCGYGSFYEHLQQANKPAIQYTGIDLSPLMISTAAKLHPKGHFQCLDILADDIRHLEADYVIMNGLFTEKRDLPFAQMLDFFNQMLQRAFRIAKKGIAFNVMQYQVDWSNPQLFHLSYDQLADILIQHCSRHFQFRSDYGLYEYTAYVYHQSNGA